MGNLSNFWFMLRGHRSRFAPRAPAYCEQPARSFGRAPAGGGATVQDRALLGVAGEKLLRTARAHGQSPALAVLQIDDLPELELVFGRAAVDQVIEAVMTELTRAAAHIGLVARTAPDTFALLMPGGGAEATVAAIQARFGKPCSIEIEFGGEEILVVPEVMVHALAPHDAVSQVYDDLCRSIAQARTPVRRKRSRVPQPAVCGGVAMGSPIVSATAARAPQYCPPLPPTIPMPLPVH